MTTTRNYLADLLIAGTLGSPVSMVLRVYELPGVDPYKLLILQLSSIDNLYAVITVPDVETWALRIMSRGDFAAAWEADFAGDAPLILYRFFAVRPGDDEIARHQAS
jgi:hypothetical protein